MQRFLNGLTSRRTLTVIGVLALAAVLFVGADFFQIDPVWPAIAVGVLIALLLVTWLVKRIRIRRANSKLGEMLEQQAQVGSEATAATPAAPARGADLDVLRTRLVDAVKTIKTSKIGQTSG